MQAIRELLLNAIVHKDYLNPTDVIIKIFDDSIEISNPEQLMRGLTVEDLQTDYYKAQHRNKLLTEAFYLTGDIEKYGTGFIRIRNWLKDYSNLSLNIEDKKITVFTIGFWEKYTHISPEVKQNKSYTDIGEQVEMLLAILQQGEHNIHDLMSEMSLKSRPKFF